MLIVVSMVALIVVSMVAYILYEGLSTLLTPGFLTQPSRSTGAAGGVAYQLFDSFSLLVITLLISVPVSLGAAVFLTEYAPDGPITAIASTAIETLSSLPSIVVGMFGFLVFSVNFGWKYITAIASTAIETLSSLPSIVVGMFGFLVFSVNFGWKYSIISGAVALTMFNIPILVRVIQQALEDVPQHQRDACLAMGLTRWEATVHVLIPAAMPAIVTGVVLSAGRVFGEAAALLFTSGMSSPVRLNFLTLNFSSPGAPELPHAQLLQPHVRLEHLPPRRVARGAHLQDLRRGQPRGPAYRVGNRRLADDLRSSVQRALPPCGQGPGKKDDCRMSEVITGETAMDQVVIGTAAAEMAPTSEVVLETHGVNVYYGSNHEPCAARYLTGVSQG